jgi:energy-converting hydrogenase Eha subunit B
VSATGSGAGCGVVLGIVFVLLAQQFGVLSLSALLPAIEYILIGAIIGGLIGALIGWGLGKRYVAVHGASSSTGGGGSGTPPAS